MNILLYKVATSSTETLILDYKMKFSFPAFLPPWLPTILPAFPPEFSTFFNTFLYKNDDVMIQM